MLAVDAGVHLAAITRILESYVVEVQSSPDSRPGTTSSDSSASVTTLLSGPFQGLELPYETTGANAAHITRDLIDTYLITHPHLDHISAFVVNTASLSSSRPKRLAGLPSTISAFKEHIFNNVIWPNLSDENNGAGLVTYMRLVEGGSSALGAGDSMGYVEVTEGLGVKTWSVSHGHCMEHHSHRGSSADIHARGRNSYDYSAPLLQVGEHESPCARPAYSLHPQPSHIFTRRFPAERNEGNDRMCVYDSSAYFIRDIATRREVLIFGDVEPDALSLSPRNLQIWTEAAPKVAAGLLKGILIECSYTDSRADTILFGHLCPRHLMTELRVLASLVQTARLALQAHPNELDVGKKRKRPSNGINVDADSNSHRRRSNRSTTNTSIPLTAPMRPGITRINSTSVSPMSRPLLRRNLSGMSVDQFDDSPIGDHFDLGPPVRPHVPSRSISGTVPVVSTIPEAHNESNGGSIEATPRQEPADTMDSWDRPITRSIDDADATRLVVSEEKPLAGLKIVIIHVKEKLEDEAPIGDTILQELTVHEENAQLGCEFVISEAGMSIYL